MLQAADTELDAAAVFDAFCDLCFATEADIGLVEAAAHREAFEAFDLRVPMRRDVLKLKRRVAFRTRGFFLTAEQFVAHEKGAPAAILNSASLLAKPVNYGAVAARFETKFGEPNRRDFVGVGVSFASIAGANDRPATYDDAYAGYEAGEGDFVVIGLNDVRSHVHVPSDTVSMTYERWIR